MNKGLVMCHVGAGKGKTTAAMGVAIRASGFGMNVYILQFIKSHKRKDAADKTSGEWPLSNEINFFENITINPPLGKIDTEQVGEGFVGILGDSKETDIHVSAAKKGLARAREIILSEEYQLVILDELISALELNLIAEKDILELIALKPHQMHIILTGHNKFESIFNECDLITDMKMVKHPYYQGVLAQEGIDY
jgi:cob(I)alamin adenosyltransferase